jgi:AcrR family transcriptional regulator
MQGVIAGEAASGRREERKAQNRAKLLEAAKKVFAEKGLGEATARDIVRETDLATGTFYNYFKDKEDAFRALLQELTDKARAAVRPPRLDPDLNVAERIEGAYRAYFEFVVEERQLFEVFRRNAGAIAVMPGEGLFESGIGDLFEDLGQWVVAGDLPQVDVDYLATAMVGAGFQVAVHLVDREPPYVDCAARFCGRLFMGGVPAVGGDAPA